MEENNHNYKKKVGIFAVVVILAEYLIRSIVNMILSHATALQSADDLYVEKYKMINQGVGVGLSLFSIAFIFLASYIFTKDKRKTVILAGSIYFGKNTAAIISSLISAIAKSLTSAAILSPSAQSAIVFTGKIAILPLIIALTYFAFTAFEGINTKLEGRSLGNSEMLLSQARKRYIIAYIFAGVVVGALTSVVPLVFSYATAYEILDYNMHATVLPAVMEIISWLGSVISFVILYLAGYKSYKSHIDGMSFMSVSGIAGAASGLVVSVAMFPLNILLTSAINSENIKLVGILSGITGATALLALASEIVVFIYVLQFFFSKSKISLFEEESYFPEISAENEADEEI